MDISAFALILMCSHTLELFCPVYCVICLFRPFCAGDNVIVGSREGKLCWFDMDLSSQPYRILKYISFFFTISLAQPE